MRTFFVRVATCIASLTLAGCGADQAEEQPPARIPTSSGAGATAAAAGSIAASSESAGRGSGTGGLPAANGGAQALPQGGTPAQPAAAGAGRMMGSSGMAGVAGITAGMPAAAGASSPTPAATGPKDGDPSKPIVSIDGIPCGPAQNAIGGGNHMIGGRDLLVEYPCEKHEGAQVTMILNLHGTLIMNAPWQYQHAYFSAHRFVTSHNLIVLTPHSVSKASSGAQWGNMDNGEDLPHVLAVIDWAYKAFTKFQVRGLWVGGHSWGAGFVAASLGGGPLACHPMLADKVKGAIGMSRLALPSCASRLSLIGTRGEKENIALLDQSAVAMGHGCMTPMQGPDKLGNNNYRHFAGCTKGWIHEDYEMLGKGHIDNMDVEVVKQIVESVKSTEEP